MNDTLTSTVLLHSLPVLQTTITPSRLRSDWANTFWRNTTEHPTSKDQQPMTKRQKLINTGNKQLRQERIYQPVKYALLTRPLIACDTLRSVKYRTEENWQFVYLIVILPNGRVRRNVRKDGQLTQIIESPIPDSNAAVMAVCTYTYLTVDKTKLSLWLSCARRSASTMDRTTETETEAESVTASIKRVPISQGQGSHRSHQLLSAHTHTQ